MAEEGGANLLTRKEISITKIKSSGPLSLGGAVASFHHLW